MIIQAYKPKNKPTQKPMWYTLYKTSTGEYLGSTGDITNIPDPLPDDTSMKTDAYRMDQGTNWDSSSKEWVLKPSERIVDICGFMNLMTLAERVAYYESHTDGVQTVKDAITGVRDMQDGIDLDDPVTEQMLQKLVDNNVITEERKTEILS